MAKKGTKQAGPPASASTSNSATAGPSKPSKISDELRQAVKDLGGDDDDLDLIEGVDSDNEDNSAPVKQKGKDSSMDEVSAYVPLLSVN